MGDKPVADGSAKKVVVLGGGLAGLSAALRLLDHGCKVTLVEKRPFLGGRAYSFRDGPEGIEIDNGQHVFLGCFTFYREFLEATGAIDKAYLPHSLRTEVVLNGRSAVLSSSPLLGKLHLLPSLLRYPHIGLKDKLLALYGLLAAKLTNRSKPTASLDDESGYDWLKRHHQTDRTIANLWNLFILPSLNDDLRDVSADMMLMVFQEALMKGPAEAAIGLSRVGLTSLNGDPARTLLEEKGTRMMLSKTVRSVRFDDGRVSGVELSDGETLEADACVSALPFQVLAQVLPDEIAKDQFFSSASALSSSPIVGIHLWYDAAIMDQDFVAFLDSPVQWVFNKNRIQEADESSGQYICISLSGAWRHIDTPKEELIDTFTQEMRRLFPRAKSARVEKSLVVKERDATFRSTPGASKHRPPQTTPIPNLFLAGEWTNTGWPSTMEGAVRSGVFAADALADRN